MIARVVALVPFLLVPFTLAGADEKKSEPIAPKEIIKLFNGKDMTGLYTWLKKTKRDDPQKVFTVHDGMIHASGEDNGYIATDKEYKDYHLVVEYKWGKKSTTDKYVRNSGVLLHATGVDGGNGGVWMSSFECQLAQGCNGDIIMIGGKNDKGEPIKMTMTAETELAPDKRRVRWKKGGEVKTWPPAKGQLWWSKHDWDFKELIDTRGKDDVESPLGEWTKVECLCDGKRITLKINGHTVNECYDVAPAAGKILLQSEGHEIYFKTFELHPLKK
jgi:hypothetical protein